METKAVIEIVNQLAEEYNNESVKGDLISRVALIESFCDENCGDRRCTDAMDRCTFIDKVLEQPTVSNDGWVSVEDRLPEEGKGVLVLLDTGVVKQYHMANIHLGKWQMWETSRNIDELGYKVLAWQPLPSLPQPYKED